jgi:hypothetical protein
MNRIFKPARIALPLSESPAIPKNHRIFFDLVLTHVDDFVEDCCGNKRQFTDTNKGGKARGSSRVASGAWNARLVRVARWCEELSHSSHASVERAAS